MRTELQILFVIGGVILALVTIYFVAATRPVGENVSGYYARGFEVDLFVPCGAEKPWQLAGRYDALSDDYCKKRSWDAEPMFVTLNGVVTEKREANLYGSRQELYILEVLDVRNPVKGDCAIESIVFQISTIKSNKTLERARC